MMDGVKIILERIKTNPEEFDRKIDNAWMMLVREYWHLLTFEEQIQIREALRGIQSSDFNERVLRKLMACKEI
jgi:hypothetical protein